MMRSMYTAVSGLRTHQGKMDVIGNNIANVNTVGFKRGQVTFKDTFSQMMTGASAPHGGKGGTNPQQIGMGVTLGSINTVHTVGNGQTTDNPTDLMIEGEGFFTVSDDVNFNNRFYTRAGNFNLDRDGNLVTADGYKVLGYAAVQDGGEYKIDDSTVTGIRVNKSDTVGASTTEKIEFRGNLDSNTPVEEAGAMKIDTNIYDSLGNVYKLTFNIEKKVSTDDKKGEWELSLDRVTEMATGNYAKIEEIPTEGNKESILNAIPISFNSEGKINSINGKGLISGDNQESFDKVKINGDSLGGIKFNYGPDGEKLTDSEGNELEGTSPLGKFNEITIFDPSRPETYNKITQYANESDLKPYEAGGNTSGTLDGFTIGKTGVVEGIFSNGERRPLGQLMLTKFDNPTGLQKMGNNFFIDTRNSGEPQHGTAGGRGFGGIAGGTLEMSNVDISYEFTEMITTQRGFQANSRVITTSDEMLQELVNIKR